PWLKQLMHTDILYLHLQTPINNNILLYNKFKPTVALQFIIYLTSRIVCDFFFDSSFMNSIFLNSIFLNSIFLNSIFLNGIFVNNIIECIINIFIIQLIFT